MSQQIEQPGYQRLQVTDQEQMTWANDKLNRKPYADRLTTLIKNTEGPYVIGLTSPWGSGKTFFLQAWHNQLVDEGKFCIYFNAWEKDASGDPLCNMIAVVQNSVEDLKERLHDDHPFKKMLTKCYVKLKDIIKATPQALKMIGNSCTMAGDTQTGAQLRAAAETVDMVSAISSFFTSQKGFKDKLADFSKATSQASNGFPLFIIVDELDRCRPSYAIDILESIKHLFNVPHVVFLLAVDSTQLLQQVEHTFGLKPCNELGNIRDPRQEYIEKFFDIYYSLPAVEKYRIAEFLLENNKQLSLYSEKFKNDQKIKLKFNLSQILTSDHNLFSNKSLRRTIQDLEIFLLFIKCNNDLQIEEIVFSFWIIMNTEQRCLYSPNKGHDFDNDSKHYISTMDLDLEKRKEFNRHPSVALFKDAHPELNSKYLCAYLFIKISMCYIDVERNEFSIQLSSAYHTGQGFFHDRKNEPTPFHLHVKKTSEIALSVIRRLQCLEDFSATLPIENPLSSIKHLTNPSA